MKCVATPIGAAEGGCQWGIERVYFVNGGPSDGGGVTYASIRVSAACGETVPLCIPQIISCDCGRDR